tara:strand:- start:390 stop:611 length:222 start_codon:yes stop_codon:yes gene_type:complete
MHIFIYSGKLKINLTYLIMNLEAGFQFIVVLLLFGSINYLIMLKRYENDMSKKKNAQIKAISRLYPKNSFIKI